MAARFDSDPADEGARGGSQVGAQDERQGDDPVQDVGRSRGSRRRRARRARTRDGADDDREVCRGRGGQELCGDLRGGQGLHPVDQKVRDDDEAELKEASTDDTHDEDAAVDRVQRPAEQPASEVRAGGAQAADPEPHVHRPREEQE